MPVPVPDSSTSVSVVRRLSNRFHMRFGVGDPSAVLESRSTGDRAPFPVSTGKPSNTGDHTVGVSVNRRPSNRFHIQMERAVEVERNVSVVRRPSSRFHRRASTFQL